MTCQLVLFGLRLEPQSTGFGKAFHAFPLTGNLTVNHKGQRAAATRLT